MTRVLLLFVLALSGCHVHVHSGVASTSAPAVIVVERRVVHVERHRPAYRVPTWAPRRHRHHHPYRRCRVIAFGVGRRC